MQINKMFYVHLGCDTPGTLTGLLQRLPRMYALQTLQMCYINVKNHDSFIIIIDFIVKTMLL